MFYSLLLLQAGEQLVYALSEGLKKIEPGKPLVVVTAKAGTAQDFSRLAGSWGLQANVLKADGNGVQLPVLPSHWQLSLILMAQSQQN